MNQKPHIGPEELLADLSQRLEEAIAFAEECRWHFSHLSEDADYLSANAFGLFAKAVRALNG